jgi:TM2 domain-containing membrane protein YozV
MSNQNFNNNSNPQNQPLIVVVQNESQALPAIVAFFFSGLGQLIQGRIIAGLL